MCSVVSNYLWPHRDCSLLGSPVQGIIQARILEWVAISYSRGSSQPKNQNHFPSLLHWQAGSLYHLNHLGSPCQEGVFKSHGGKTTTHRYYQVFFLSSPEWHVFCFFFLTFLPKVLWDRIEWPSRPPQQSSHFLNHRERHMGTPVYSGNIQKKAPKAEVTIFL